MNFGKQKLSGDLKNIYLPRLSELSSTTKPKVSFEFFPPKSPEMEIKLWNSIKKLESLKPQFVSVTYGAGGTTRERTHKTVERIVKETNLAPAAHLTCVGASKDEIKEVAESYWNAGIKHIVALRGDAPAGSGKYQPHPQGYAYASDLVEGLRKLHDFEISVAAYSETHPEAVSEEADLNYLKLKLDMGAKRAITQYFFDTDLYFRFMEKVEKKGITAPVIPGIVPVPNYQQIVKFSKACGASVPKWLGDLLEHLDNDPETHNLVSACIAAEQARLLIAGGVKELHFYTLNRADLTYAVCQLLGIKG